MLQRQLRPLDDADATARWNALAEVAAVASPFSAPDVIRGIAASSGTTASLVFATDDGSDVAAIATFSRRAGPLRKLVHPSTAYYSPILLRSAPDPSSVHQQRDGLSVLLKTLKQLRHRPRVQLPPTIVDIRPAHGQGLVATPFYTFTARPGENRSAKWSSSSRRLFERYHNQYELDDSAETVAPVVEMAQQAYERSGRKSPFQAAPLVSAIHRLRAGGHVATLGLRDSNVEVKGGVMLLRNRDTACYWISGSEPGPAMTVMVGRLLEWLAAEGVKEFDFMGANTFSIAEFKRRFGTTLRPFFHVTWPGGRFGTATSG